MPFKRGDIVEYWVGPEMEGMWPWRKYNGRIGIIVQPMTRRWLNATPGGIVSWFTQELRADTEPTPYDGKLLRLVGHIELDD